jgi:hypothetical protein
LAYNKDVPKKHENIRRKPERGTKKGSSNFRRKPERGTKKGLKITPLPPNDDGGVSLEDVENERKRH